ncbi:MAG: metalloregulator ArsR/SmtB family transcription factor [Bacteroidota bacterium]
MCWDSHQRYCSPLQKRTLRQENRNCIRTKPTELSCVQQKRMCVCELQEALGISQPSVSKHLKILEEAGVVDYLKDGLWVNYFLENANNNPYVAAMLGNLEHWLDDDPQIAELIEMMEYHKRTLEDSGETSIFDINIPIPTYKSTVHFIATTHLPNIIGCIPC